MLRLHAPREGSHSILTRIGIGRLHILHDSAVIMFPQTPRVLVIKSSGRAQFDGGGDGGNVEEDTCG
jgi:hypothetical protein